MVKKNNKDIYASSAKETKGTKVPEVSPVEEVKTEVQKKEEQTAAEVDKEGRKAEATLARVKVVKDFFDKYNLNVRHTTGEELEVDEARAQDLITRKLAKRL